MIKITLLLSVLFFVSCSSSEESTQITSLNEEIEKLKQDKFEEDSTVNHYVEKANLLHDNINLINSKQKELLKKIKNNPELLSGDDPAIKNEIEELGEMIDENNTDLNRFKDDYSNSNLEANGINELIGNATENIDNKNEEISGLQEQLEAVDVAFEDLFSVFGETLAELDETKNTLNETKDYLNTVWFIVDTKKGLEEKDITSSTGGFIGIGKNEELKGNFNINHFTQGNKKSLRKIALPKNFKKFELVTSHPKDSYNISNSVLDILNQNDFWSISKYLVISGK